MPSFRYKALSPDGDIIEGQLFSDDRRGVIERLRDRGAITLSAEVVRSRVFASRRMRESRDSRGWWSSPRSASTAFGGREPLATSSKRRWLNRVWGSA